MATKGITVNDKQLNALTNLFERTADAHSRAFSAAGGVDLEWPIWYADYTNSELRSILDRPDFTKSSTICCLLAAEDEYVARAIDTERARYYAEHFLSRCGNPEPTSLALYYYPSCPFCRVVLREIDRLDGVNVELRDIWENPEYRQELLNARGRTTVPVLRISSVDGHEQWMPESAEIAAYLRRNFHSSGSG
jgi:glutaredoxin